MWLVRAATRQPKNLRQGCVQTRRFAVLADRIIADQYCEGTAGAPGRLVEAREAFETRGFATLPAFLRPAALRSAVEELTAKTHLAWEVDVRHNVLQRDPDPAQPPCSARNREETTRVSCIAHDMLDPNGVLLQLYSSEILLSVVADVVGADHGKPFRLADPLGACSVNLYRCAPPKRAPLRPPLTAPATMQGWWRHGLAL